MAEVRKDIVQLLKQLEWARQIRLDPAQTTYALQLADAVIEMTELAIEVEAMRQEQIDKFHAAETMGAA
jgi:hypothetical protein